MKKFKSLVYFVAVIALCFGSIPVSAQRKGLKTITGEELRYHLEFLGAPEFRGRETPSPELEIATLYLGNWAKNAGLEPILPDGSFYQTIPISVTSVVESHTRLRVMSLEGERYFYYGKSFGGSFRQSGSYSGDVVFAGLGISEPDKGWDDLKDLDLTGKIVVIMDAQPPDNMLSLGSTYSYRLYSRINTIRDKGAAAVLSIVDPARAAKGAEGMDIFDDIPSGRMEIMYASQRREPSTPQTVPQQEVTNRPPLPFGNAQIGFDVAAAILDVSKNEILDWFERIQKGQPVPHREITDVTVRLDVEVEQRSRTTRSVIAQVPGSDPVLGKEYIVICAHHDHLGISDGEIIAGADDNGTGTVALMEIAQALVAERPKRTVIIAWFTGEERGYFGSQYFVNNCPVPIEKISACLNMDMLGRNDIDHLYLVGSDLLSSELDGAIHKVNREYKINFNFDYLYSNLTHPQRVYFRSD
ncbi:MAG: M28 family peptidase, partial [Candidatus Aminicenantes bacterium]|nr:M28 family peptidase [Candidatus Aminicenantes bacterium]